jgi:hypothetical protein
MIPDTQKLETEPKYLDIKTFQDFGYLQEVNRLFFHPLGLALDILRDSEGNVSLGGIQDYRDEIGGVRFGPGVIDEKKIANIFRERASRAEKRYQDFGELYQQPDEISCD